LRGGPGLFEGADYGKISLLLLLLVSLTLSLSLSSPLPFVAITPSVLLIDILQTMEVALARVYNWDVVQKRKEKADEEKTKGKGKGKEAA